jgi:hypothetical protein
MQCLHTQQLHVSPLVPTGTTGRWHLMIFRASFIFAETRDATIEQIRDVKPIALAITGCTLNILGRVLRCCLRGAARMKQHIPPSYTLVSTAN